jgi:hypothetical protein
MIKESTRTRFRAGEFISEDAVRGAFGRRPRTRPAHPAEAVGALAANRPIEREEASPTAGRPAPLRRWSVAELIARAVAAPPADAVGHC